MLLSDKNDIVFLFTGNSPNSFVFWRSGSVFQRGNIVFLKPPFPLDKYLSGNTKVSGCNSTVLLANCIVEDYPLKA
ncbi:hypothetical protein COX23_05850 [Candidatus Gottesmanbacteria bacterium CG23_combo_of_CG06-09_8_20_14_all_37_19]|nr:MAG: hypothetical protein COX23_05850 [Candidatus Gottesmanbacteria bacterium CG23_combo_of_CG06-09_8_20_14_all_37_19]